MSQSQVLTHNACHAIIDTLAIIIFDNFSPQWAREMWHVLSANWGHDRSLVDVDCQEEDSSIRRWQSRRVLWLNSVIHDMDTCVDWLLSLVQLADDTVAYCAFPPPHLLTDRNHHPLFAPCSRYAPRASCGKGYTCAQTVSPRFDIANKPENKIWGTWVLGHLTWRVMTFVIRGTHLARVITAMARYPGANRTKWRF